VPADRKQDWYVYVLSSSGNDYFPEIAAFSVAMILDRETSAMHSSGLDFIRPLIDNLLVVDCPGRSPLQRSRYLKSGVCLLMPGRLFYLDCDTLVMKSF
jgi:hypothetical protein